MKLKASPKRVFAGAQWSSKPLNRWRDSLFRDTRLGWRDKAVFMALHSLMVIDGKPFPALNEIAAEAAMSLMSLKSCLNHLEYSGWIEMHPRVRNKFSVGGGIVYTLWYTVDLL